MTHRSVLRVNAVEETDRYRDAVAEIIRNVLCDHKVTLIDIAERTDISLGTVSNAANKKADLNAIYLARIGKAFGQASLDLYARLFDARVTSIEHDDDDVLPAVAQVMLEVATARSPSSPGGVVETLSEELSQMQSLRRAQRLIDAKIARIENRKEAA